MFQSKKKQSMPKKGRKKLIRDVKNTKKSQYKYEAFSIKLENGQFSYCSQQMCAGPKRPYFDNHLTNATSSSEVLRSLPNITNVKKTENPSQKTFIDNRSKMINKKNDGLKIPHVDSHSFYSTSSEVERSLPNATNMKKTKNVVQKTNIANRSRMSDRKNDACKSPYFNRNPIYTTSSEGLRSLPNAINVKKTENEAQKNFIDNRSKLSSRKSEVPKRPYFDRHLTHATLSSEVLRSPTPAATNVRKNENVAQKTFVDYRNKNNRRSKKKVNKRKADESKAVNQNGESIKQIKNNNRKVIKKKVKPEVKKVWPIMEVWPEDEISLKEERRTSYLKTKDQSKKNCRETDKIKKEIIRENKHIRQIKILSIEKRLTNLRIETAKNNVAQENQIAQKEKLKSYKISTQPNKERPKKYRFSLESNKVKHRPRKIQVKEVSVIKCTVSGRFYPYVWFELERRINMGRGKQLKKNPNEATDLDIKRSKQRIKKKQLKVVVDFVYSF